MVKVLQVDGMSCEHCVKHVTDAVNEIDGAKCVNVSLDENEVTVNIENEEILEKIIVAINDLGYEVISYE